MNTRVSVVIPDGGFSDPITINGQLVGALVTASAWDGSGSNLGLTLEVPVEETAPYSTWRPINSPAIIAALGSGNSTTQHYFYGPVDPAAQDLPPVVRFGWFNGGAPVAGEITIDLVLKSGCSVTVSC